jgi:hypothetical protein
MCQTLFNLCYLTIMIDREISTISPFANKGYSHPPIVVRAASTTQPRVTTW